MTEIPEHLLKRAAERRAALSGEEAPAESDAAPAGGEAAPATPAAQVEKAPAAPAPLPTLDREAAAPPPDSPVVAAAKRRKRVPFWAAPVVALLPLWGIIYVSAVSEPPAGEADPLVIGSEVYAGSCSGCHGADGAGAAAGGTGQQLNEGEVIKTFADPLAQVYWISHGTDGAARPDGTYGDLDREGGPRNVDTLSTNMGAFDSLGAEELAAVTIYIRSAFGGADYDPIAEDPNFNAELFEEDPAALEALVEEVLALDLNDPDAVDTLEGAETE